MFRILAGSLTIVAAFGAQALAAASISEDIPVPGGTVALARAIGLETPPDPSRFVAEVARLTYGLPDGHRDGPASTLHRLTTHLDAAGRFQAALDGLRGGGALTLAIASGSKADREQLKTFLELIDLRLKESQGRYSVDAANDKAAADRVQLLADLGVNLEGFGRRLNAGETVQVGLPIELVPVPLAAALWGEVVFRRAVPPSNLFSAIFADRRAALLCHGLAALDDETLQYVADTPRLLEQLYGQNAAPVFATFASSMRVHEGRVVTPGGAAAVPLWESVVGETVVRPELFLYALLSGASGHVAYLYDLITELDAPRAAFALGLWIEDERVRMDRFKSLVSVIHLEDSDWNVHEVPFARPLDDIGILLLNVQAGTNGAPEGPAALTLWSRAFESLDLPENPSKAIENADEKGRVDAAWLADAILAGDRKLRSQRLQQLAFGLRAFVSRPQERLGDVLTAVRALPAYPALVLTIERMGIADPAVYAVAARTAHRLSELDASGAFPALEQFQGALALLSHMKASGGLEPSRAGSLVTSLAAIPLTKDGRYGARVAQWVRNELLAAIAPRGSAEQAVLGALAGATGAARSHTERVIWEGEQYRLDLPAAEERRLRTIRERQRGYSIETALDLERIARSLGSASIDLAGIQEAVAALRALLPKVASGTEGLPDATMIVNRAMKDLSKIVTSKDAKRAAAIAEPLGDLSGAVLGGALGAIVYALHVGDPAEGTLLAADLSRRHDFGLALKDKAARRLTPWSIPRQIVEPGVPRRVLGSLLGLDVAFASLTLRRVVTESATSAPVLLSNDRDTFTKSVALLNPYTMRDEERDAIAAAVAKGRARVEGAVIAAGVRTSADGVGSVDATDTPDTLDGLAAEIKLDGWRRRAAQWDAAHDPRRVPSFFSLNELLTLGAGQASGSALNGSRLNLDGWGMSGTPISGCLCTRLAAPNEWRIVGGRPQAGVMSRAVPDINLHVAVMLATLRLPAALARMVVGAAVQEFVDEVRPNDANDWLTLTRAARMASRERIEDYVAAATADGPLIPEAGDVEQQP